MTNYSLDEIERKESQKQREQRSHGLDERYSSKEGFRVDDQKDIKNIVKSSKPCQQWDAQTQSYVSVDDYVNAEDTGYVGVIPATEYKVDELNFPKKGKGRCLHCKKLVGYVGGFPAVNPPDAICD